MDTGFLGRTGWECEMGSCPLYNTEKLECKELWLKRDNETAESLWVRVCRQTNMDGIEVINCYRSPDQGETG